ncbi:MAG: hypothetical protein C0412_12665, partial [Flavobacterium sp.]|nr:hypothetical protein [Flavobacterium sp.]
MADSKAFGKTLNDLLSQQGISQIAFASKLGVSRQKVSEWLSGTKMPNMIYSKKIVEVLSIDEKLGNELLSLLDHSSEKNSEVSNVYRPTGILINSNMQNPTTNISDPTLQKQFEQTLATIGQISSKLNKIPPSQTFNQTEILAEIQKLKDSLSQNYNPARSITAPVILPPTEDMEVRLVSSNSLQRLEEYRSEENKWFTVMGIFIGAIFGLLINIMMGTKMTTNAWVLFFIFTGFAIITGITA